MPHRIAHLCQDFCKWEIDPADDLPTLTVVGYKSSVKKGEVKWSIRQVKEDGDSVLDTSGTVLGPELLFTSRKIRPVAGGSFSALIDDWADFKLEVKEGSTNDEKFISVQNDSRFRPATMAGILFESDLTTLPFPWIAWPNWGKDEASMYSKLKPDLTYKHWHVRYLPKHFLVSLNNSMTHRAMCWTGSCWRQDTPFPRTWNSSSDFRFSRERS